MSFNEFFLIYYIKPNLKFKIKTRFSSFCSCNYMIICFFFLIVMDQDIKPVKVSQVLLYMMMNKINLIIHSFKRIKVKPKLKIIFRKIKNYVEYLKGSC